MASEPRAKGPGPRAKGQGTRDQGPGTRNQEPGTRDQGPRTMDQGPPDCKRNTWVATAIPGSVEYLRLIHSNTSVTPKATGPSLGAIGILEGDL